MELTRVGDLDLSLHELLVPSSPLGIVAVIPEESTGAAEGDEGDHAKGDACRATGVDLDVWDVDVNIVHGQASTVVAAAHASRRFEPPGWWW